MATESGGRFVHSNDGDQNDLSHYILALGSRAKQPSKTEALEPHCGRIDQQNIAKRKEQGLVCLTHRTLHAICVIP